VIDYCAIATREAGHVRAGPAAEGSVARRGGGSVDALSGNICGRWHRMREGGGGGAQTDERW
jgi:hypothetical protein